MKMKKKAKQSVMVIAFILIILVGVVLYFTVLKKDEAQNKGEENPPAPVPQIKIVDPNSKSRPYAVMINNHASARKNHAGLQDAYLAYEMIVEGGMTRYLALFKDQDTAKIGSVRSARHYFLDYALENDAYYVHWGWSPQAQSDIRSLKVNNINGLTYEGTYFYRDKTLNIATEHTGFTKMEMLEKAVTKLKYRNDTNADLLLNYKVDEINVNEKEDAKVANKVSIKYSGSMTTSYEYDSGKKVYKRIVNGNAHVDAITKEQYTAKNIITYQVHNSTIAADDKGRQEFDNVGSGTGYYITNGYAVPIKWSKANRSAQTKYTYSDGTEINVNDGNTWIQIQPKGQTLTFA